MFRRDPDCSPAAAPTRSRTGRRGGVSDRARRRRRVGEPVDGDGCGACGRRVVLVGLASVAQHAVPHVDAPRPEPSAGVHPACHLPLPSPASRPACGTFDGPRSTTPRRGGAVGSAAAGSTRKGSDARTADSDADSARLRAPAEGGSRGDVHRREVHGREEAARGGEGDRQAQDLAVAHRYRGRRRLPIHPLRHRGVR